MKVGNLIRRIATGKIGIITEVVNRNKDTYYWIYTDDYGKFEHIMLHSVSIRKL